MFTRFTYLWKILFIDWTSEGCGYWCSESRAIWSEHFSTTRCPKLGGHAPCIMVFWPVTKGKLNILHGNFSLFSASSWNGSHRNEARVTRAPYKRRAFRQLYQSGKYKTVKKLKNVWKKSPNSSLKMAIVTLRQWWTFPCRPDSWQCQPWTICQVFNRDFRFFSNKNSIISLYHWFCCFQEYLSDVDTKIEEISAHD